MKCLNCNKETKNPKFCSISCSTIYNNHKKPKIKKLQRFCKTCGCPVEGRHQCCTKCNKNIVDWNTVTLADMFNKRTHQKSSRIREHSRNVYIKEFKTLSCKICGYINHVEVCHIKPINDFSFFLNSFVCT
jgi:hypothetical protein